MPENLEEASVSLAKVKAADVSPPAGEGGSTQNINSDPADTDRAFIRADKLLKEAGLAASTTEAGRKIKEKAVSVEGVVLNQLMIVVSLRKALTVRMGRKIKKIVLTIP